MQERAILVAGVLAVVLALGACGDDEGANGTGAGGAADGAGAGATTIGAVVAGTGLPDTAELSYRETRCC